MSRSLDFGWKLKLFMSVDMVDSTRFKSEHRDLWFKVFDEFFEDIPLALAKRYTDTKITVPRIWKFLGDEILFVVDLRQHTDAIEHLWRFKETVHGFSDKYIERNRFPKEEKVLLPSLKAAAWTAGFPVQNAELTLKGEAKDKEITDYVGPSIDLGFRISRFADGRRIPISIELARILLDGRSRCPKMQFGFSGSAPLKGINLREDYPFIWVDRLDGRKTLEDRVMRRTPTCTPRALSSFLNEAFKRYDITRPFIDGAKDGRYGVIPKEMTKRRMGLMKNYYSPDDSYAWSEEKKVVGEDQTGKVPPLGPLTFKRPRSK